MTIKITNNGITTIDKINLIERKYGVKFDNSYINFLLSTNGGENNEVGADFFEVNLGSAETFSANINRMYGIDNINNEKATIQYVTEDYIEMEHVVAIGDTETSGLIIFVDLPEQRGYYYYDDTYFFEESSDESNTYWLCETFDEFQAMVKNPD